MGAMAIEVATLRPIFPGNNEIDQLWRVTEVMGTPSDWHTTDERTGRKIKIGGGPWSHGLKLAAALNFKFPQVCLSLALPIVAHWHPAGEMQLRAEVDVRSRRLR
jgi:meiosis induction protein kinase IME2/SME1